MSVYGIYITVLLLAAAVTFIALILAILVRGKERYHCVNVLLTASFLSIALLQSYPFLPIKGIKARGELNPAELMDVLSVTLVMARRIETAVEKTPALQYLYKYNYPMNSPSITYKSAAKEMGKEIEKYSDPALTDSYLLINRKVQLLGMKPTKADEEAFAAAIAPPPEVSVDDNFLSRFPGWFRDQYLYYYWRGTNKIAEAEQLEEKWREDSDAFVWRFVAFATLALAMAAIGAVTLFRIFGSLKNITPAFDSVETGKGSARMALGVLIVSYVAALTAAYCAGLALKGVAEPLRLTLLLSTEIGAMFVASIISVHLLLLKPQNRSFAKFFRASPTELPLRIRQGLIGLMVSQFLVSLAQITQKLIYQSNETTNPATIQMLKLADNPEPLSIIMMLAIAVIVGPVLEEILFRGVIYKRLRQSRLPMPMAVIISAAIFGFVHLDFNQFLSIFTAGIVLAVSYERTKSILVPMIIHMGHNLLSFLMLFLLV